VAVEASLRRVRLSQLREFLALYGLFYGEFRSFLGTLARLRSFASSLGNGAGSVFEAEKLLGHLEVCEADVRDAFNDALKGLLEVFPRGSVEFPAEPWLLLRVYAVDSSGKSLSISLRSDLTVSVEGLDAFPEGVGPAFILEKG